MFLTLIKSPGLVRLPVTYYEMSGFTFGVDETREKLQGRFLKMFIDFYGPLAYAQDFENEFGRNNDLFGIPENEEQVKMHFDVESRKLNTEYLHMLGEAQQLQEYYEYRYREQLEGNRTLQNAITNRLDLL